MAEPVPSSTTSSRIVIFTFLVAVWASVAWALLWPVDKSCEFVYLTGHYVDDDMDGGDGRNAATVSIHEEYFIYRGTQRGMMLPQDPCQPWRTYEGDGTVQLDRYMVIVRASTALSIVLGFFLWIYIFLIALRSNGCFGQSKKTGSRTKEGDAMEETSEQQRSRCTCCCIRSGLEWTVTSRSMKIIAIFLSICVAVFQALTHLMVHSSLCEDSEPIEVVFETEGNGSSQTVIYDTCLHDTVAYTLTFVTMFMWVVLAIMIGFVPLVERRRREEEDGDEDDDRPRQQQQLHQKEDEASGAGVDDTDEITSCVDPSTKNNTIKSSDSTNNECDNIDV